MKLCFYSREQSQEICTDAWRSLAERAMVNNPFYEHWNLIPALLHLEQSKDIELVTAWRGEELVALFPICFSLRLPFFKVAFVWKHDECYCTSPLVLDQSAWDEILPLLWTKRRVHMLINTTQVEQALTSERTLHLSQCSYLRPALNCSKSYEEMSLSWSRKRRKEYRRLLRNSLEKKQASYHTSSSEQGCESFFKEYTSVESKGWKGRAGSAISLNPDTLNYYQAMIAAGCTLGKIEMQKLDLNGTAIAASVRLITAGKAFEVKTSYCENHRELAPGVLLELLNMRNLAEGDLNYADSCTQPGNRVLEGLWHDRTAVFNSVYFGSSLLCKLAWFATKLYKEIKNGKPATHEVNLQSARCNNLSLTAA